MRELERESDPGEKPHGPRGARSPKTLQKQHAQLVAFLKESGVTVEAIPALAGVATAVRVGDVALVLPEAAVMGRSNDAIRAREVDSVLATVAQHRPVESIVDPGIFDAADALRIGRTIYVAESPRTNADGIGQLGDIVASHGYNLRVVSLLCAAALTKCCSFIPPHFLLLNRRRIDVSGFENVITLDADEAEPHAASTFTVGRKTVISASARNTRKKLKAAGVEAVPLDISEFEKMDAGLTSLVLLLEPRPANHWAPETGVMPVRLAGVPVPDNHASQAVVHAGFVFTSAVFPFDPATGAAKRMTFEEQMETVITNLAAVLKASGSSMARVVRTTVHVAEAKHVPRIDAMWPRLFGDHRPARAIVANGALPPGVLVGIEAVAAHGDKAR